MKVAIVRHGISEANNRNNVGTMAFANPNAPLMGLGREQAKDLGVEMVIARGFSSDEPIAVSELVRVQETARLAGFYTTRAYPGLNEAVHGLPLDDLRTLLGKGELPPKAIVQAETLLNNPPEERIWISHGLVIAGLCQALGIYQDKRLIPAFCEIRELDL